MLLDPTVPLSDELGLETGQETPRSREISKQTTGTSSWPKLYLIITVKGIERRNATKDDTVIVKKERNRHKVESRPAVMEKERKNPQKRDAKKRSLGQQSAKTNGSSS